MQSLVKAIHIHAVRIYKREEEGWIYIFFIVQTGLVFKSFILSVLSVPCPSLLQHAAP
jgi:hypothetical protein